MKIGKSGKISEPARWAIITEESNGKQQMIFWKSPLTPLFQRGRNERFTAEAHLPARNRFVAAKALFSLNKLLSVTSLPAAGRCAVCERHSVFGLQESS
jgi:hypothetical protein